MPDLRAGSALLAMSVAVVCSPIVLERRDRQTGSDARGHFLEPGAGCFDVIAAFSGAPAKPRAVARWRAGDRRGDLLRTVT